ncbi:hypothetical protein Droror1_Dr00001359 [Drosera rotundifolia]
MAVKFPQIMHQAKGFVRQTSFRFSRGQTPSTHAATMADVPRGHLAVYVGVESKNRFVIPIACLEQPLFQDLLKKAEEEFDFIYPMGGLILPCSEDSFLDAISDLTSY